MGEQAEQGKDGVAKKGRPVGIEGEPKGVHPPSGRRADHARNSCLVSPSRGPTRSLDFGRESRAAT
jgi:hypothetical protein